MKSTHLEDHSKQDNKIINPVSGTTNVLYFSHSKHQRPIKWNWIYKDHKELLHIWTRAIPTVKNIIHEYVMSSFSLIFKLGFVRLRAAVRAVFSRSVVCGKREMNWHGTPFLQVFQSYGRCLTVRSSTGCGKLTHHDWNTCKKGSSGWTHGHTLAAGS